MSLENQLEKLVTQVTRIADNMDRHATMPPPVKTKEKPGAKEKPAAKDEPALKEPLDAPEPETGHTVEECHKYLFDTLTKVKAHKGIDTAKAVCAGFMKKYTGGKPVTVDVIPEAVLDKFYQEVQRVRAQHGIEE